MQLGMRPTLQEHTTSQDQRVNGSVPEELQRKCQEAEECIVLSQKCLCFSAESREWRTLAAVEYEPQTTDSIMLNSWTPTEEECSANKNKV